MAYGVLKVISPDGLDIDSAEQVYFAQSWQLGYGTRQPPLYTWLLLLLKPVQVSWALARACGADRSVQAKVLLAHLGMLLAMWCVRCRGLLVQAQCRAVVPVQPGLCVDHHLAALSARAIDR